MYIRMKFLLNCNLFTYICHNSTSAFFLFVILHVCTICIILLWGHLEGSLSCVDSSVSIVLYLPYTCLVNEKYITTIMTLVNR